MPFDGGHTDTTEYLEKLDAIIDLIGTPEKWTQGHMHRGARYCLRGAVRKVDKNEVLRPAILSAISEVMGCHYRRIETFNDHDRTDHDTILAVLMKARENIAVGHFVVSPKREIHFLRLSHWWNRCGAKSPGNEDRS